ncbi:peroxide stress protein YaaA [Sunxiuqinia sp. A32]|uniref:peroxide stress protein YaaA n=1 Tax=Sunxiuqinia sp. A32 TaxID=3461496 RepID=UPI0040464606
MIAIISPAKSLDFKTKPVIEDHTIPIYLNDAKKINKQLKTLSPQELVKLMGISAKLAELNFERNFQWKPPFTPENAKQAALAFNGDVYLGLDANTLTANEFKIAQERIRILSGLYGLLKPLDLIQAYRLEMGTRLQIGKYKDLYDFWQLKITKELNKELAAKGGTLINLASIEYFKAIDKKKLKGEIITPAFKEHKNGKYQMISFFAKKARGLMCRFMVKNNIQNPEDLKAFDLEGYYFNNELSKGNDWVFTRDKQL